VLRLEWSQVLWRLRRPARPLLILVGTMVGAPLVMETAINLVGAPEFLRTPLVLIASSPPLISVPAFALLLGLDAPLALVVMVAGFALQPLVQPPVALALVGVTLDIGLGPLMLRLAVFVGGAFAAAAAVRWIAGDARVRRHNATFGGIVILMLLVFAIGVMDGLRAEFAGRSLVWVLHRASLARNFDRVLVMSGGKLQEQGRFSDLDNKDSLTALLMAAE